MKKTLLLILFTGLFNLVSFAQPDAAELQKALKNASFREKFEAANDLFYQKKYYHSLVIWLNLAEDQPQNSNINYKIGVCYLNSNTDKNKALPFLEKIKGDVSKQWDPYTHQEKRAPIEAYYYLAKAYHLDYQFDKAIDSYGLFKDKAHKKHALNTKAEMEIAQCKLAKTMVSTPNDWKIENLGEVINGKYSDFSPVLSLDGNAIYFTSRRIRKDSSNEDEFNPNDGKHFEDIYYSLRDKKTGEWQEPKTVNFSEIDRNEATIGVSADGLKLYVYIDDEGDGNIYYSEYEDTLFSDLEFMESDINSEAWETHATISTDGKTLYFVSDRKGGLGGRDIYRCRRLPNGEWSKAQNVGAPINSEFDEDSPFLSADGKNLYFSNNGRNSMGGFDIFVSPIKDEETQTWSEPVNLGYPLNTVNDDVFFIVSADGKTGYYSSLHQLKGSSGHGLDGGYGEKDIYSITFDTAVVSEIAILKGYIIPDEDGVIPSDIEIYVTHIESGEQRGPYTPRPDDGGYVMDLEPCNNYLVEYFNDGDLFYETNVDVPCHAGYQEIKKEVYLNPVETVELPKGDLVHWKALNNLNELKRATVSYYDAKGDIAGTTTISQHDKFGYPFADHDNIHKFKISGIDQELCNKSCFALLDTNDNILGYAIKTGDCIYQIEHLTYKWQLLADDKPVDKNNIKIIYKDSDGNITNNENLGCNGMFPYHNLESDKVRLFEIDADDESLCKEMSVVLLDKNNNIVGKTQRDGHCLFTYEKATDIPEAKYQKFFTYNKRNISRDEREFKEFISKVEQIISAKGYVNIEIESSASKVPTRTYKTNDNLTNKRANDAKTRLLQALKAKGIDSSKVKFIAVNALVLGPDYKDDFRENRKEYEKYQYVKVTAK